MIHKNQVLNIKKMRKKIVTFSLFLMGSYMSHAQQKIYPLDFNPGNFTTEEATVAGKTIKFRVYTNVVYVKNPIDIKYQSLNFYVPVEYYEGKSIDVYNESNAPIFMPNDVGGYMPALPGKAGIDPRSGKANAALVALSKGYVVAYPGARGRTLRDSANGKYYGKAPAQIVDLKAVVRYLKFNDKEMPGDASKIITNGTSAGGAMSTLLGGTGNNKDYAPYLAEIGAADATDDIFAVSAYCPITNLDHADAAYEWLYYGTKEYKRMAMGNMIDYHQERKEITGSLTDEQIALSKKLKDLFPAYVNALKLKDGSGKLLKLDKKGDGTFRDFVGQYIIVSAQGALDDGKNLSSFDWLTINGNKVTALDFPKYINYTKRMKLPPAFDALDLSTGENDLFGTSDINVQHFTDFGFKNSTVKSTLADAQIIKMMNALYYIGTKGTTVSKHWRVRHGTIDKDGSLAIPAILTAKLRNLGYEVDLAFPWETPHSGDYDLDELFQWIKDVVTSANK